MIDVRKRVYDRLSVATGLPWFVTFSGGKDSAEK
jgi:3'-phosphoadenosine 5'-phosphosulfate sulfotransferase (PAPS reductase)/FAD synthetase